MNPSINETHDPTLRSWVESANDPRSDFPIQNLPYGVFRSPDNSEPRIGVAIGDHVLDLRKCADQRLLGDLRPDPLSACREPALNALMSLGPKAWTVLRRTLSRALRSGSTDNPQPWRECLLPMSDVEMCLPARIGNYTDFYASIHHATNVGSLFRPDSPLLPNYKYVPIAYHGRASSLVISGTPLPRPWGQLSGEKGPPPSFAPTAALDYELEVGFCVGEGNVLGEPIPMAEAPRHIFGVCLLNDWSARDIQKWEYQPLGPFLAKNFRTTLSPWIVTLEALAPFRAPALARSEGDPAPLPHLTNAEDAQQGAIAATLEVWITTERMRAAGEGPTRLSRSHLADLYWTPAQLVAHHTSNGCNLRPGDLLASGTVSGPAPENRGCLLELTKGGKEHVTLPGGQIRRFLKDGDEVILRGFCEREGYRRIGLGECRGTITPPRPENAPSGRTPTPIGQRSR